MAVDLEEVSVEEHCGGRLHTFRWEGDRMVRAWMPEGHDPGREKLPCLWMQDGQNVFRDEVAFGGVSWGAGGSVTRLVDAGCIPRMAVIAVDHAGVPRHPHPQSRPFDYLPAPPGNWDGRRNDMGGEMGGNVEAYSARLLSELLPWGERRFGLSPDASDRALGGSSFGGVATLYMALLHPKAFRAVLIESPSFWACGGRIMRDVRGHAGADWPERIYLAMGGCEYSGTRPGSGDAGAHCDRSLAGWCKEFAAVLNEQGVGPGRLDWHVEPGAAHNERDWRWRFPRALRWLFAGEGGPPPPAAALAPAASASGAGGGAAAPAAPPFVWSRPAPVVAGRAFEIYVDADRLQLPRHSQHLRVHLGFNNWTCDVQDAPLLPAGLPREVGGEGGEGAPAWLAATAVAPAGASDVHFALTDGTAWDNNDGLNYQLPIS